jgi:hypothetical protein
VTFWRGVSLTSRLRKTNTNGQFESRAHRAAPSGTHTSQLTRQRLKSFFKKRKQLHNRQVQQRRFKFLRKQLHDRQLDTLIRVVGRWSVGHDILQALPREQNGTVLLDIVTSHGSKTCVARQSKLGHANQEPTDRKIEPFIVQVILKIQIVSDRGVGLITSRMTHRRFTDPVAAVGTTAAAAR